MRTPGSAASSEREFRSDRRTSRLLLFCAGAFGPEAGIDILLYRDGKRWRVYEPEEEP